MTTDTAHTAEQHTEPGAAPAAEPAAAASSAPPPPAGQAQQAHQHGQPAPQHHYAHQTSDPRQKSPFLAGLLSFVPGLGQVYVGYYQRGFVHAAVVAALISLLASGDFDELTPMAAIFMVFFWLYNVIDAARRASLYNDALVGVGGVDLPDDWKVPGFRGSILGGAVIAAFGTLLLMETLFNVSLEWLEDWWPVAIIAFGLYLIYKAIADRREREEARAAEGE